MDGSHAMEDVIMDVVITSLKPASVIWVTVEPSVNILIMVTVIIITLSLRHLVMFFLGIPTKDNYY